MDNRVRSQAGFSMVELLIGIAIIAFILISMMELFIYTSSQAQMAGNVTQAVSQGQSKMEEIRNHTYANIVADYSSGGSPGSTFDLTGITGKGRIYIDSSNAELLQIKVVVSWRDKYSRVVGEDKNLNGSLDSGEDANGNGQLNSPVELVSMITRR